MVTAVVTLFFFLLPDPLVGGARGRGGVAVRAMTGGAGAAEAFAVRYETIGSTNDEAKRLARDGAAEGTVVWAREQTAGRGRRGRAWVSPPGNLYVSLVLRPRCAAAEAAQLGFVAALALGDAHRRPSAGDSRYKWPNDLLAQRQEDRRHPAGDRDGCRRADPDFVVIGVGVNLAIVTSRRSYIRRPRWSRRGQRRSRRKPALAGFIEHFAASLVRWREDGFSPIRTSWLVRAKGLGEAVQVRLESGRLDGRFPI